MKPQRVSELAPKTYHIKRSQIDMAEREEIWKEDRLEKRSHEK